MVGAQRNLLPVSVARLILQQYIDGCRKMDFVPKMLARTGSSTPPQQYMFDPSSPIVDKCTADTNTALNAIMVYLFRPIRSG